MIYAVMMMCYGQLELTKQCFESLVAQDIGPMEILVINNGSTDGTREWLDSQVPRFGLENSSPNTLRISHHPVNQSPVKMFNEGAQFLWDLGYEYILCVANDVVLPPNSYRLMDQWPRGIVTASETRDINFPVMESTNAVSENTPMSLMLLRKWVWDAVIAKDGYFFDEGMFCYASDCDLALRIASCGIRGVQLDMSYYHYGSASWKLTSPEEQQRAQEQANMDRAYFEKKWHFKVDALEYGQRAVDLNFKGKAE